MPDRRDVLRAGLGLAACLGAAIPPRAARAFSPGRPAFLAAGLAGPDRHVLCGLDGDGGTIFTLALEGRGHDTACHPTRPEAVTLARRPGSFALVVECRTGRVLQRLEAPPGRHFYGHGVYRPDGALLFTTENDMDALEGRIGVWDVAAGYARVGEFASGGIGPHDCLWLPGAERLVVANGGLATHPDSGRAILNLATMRPNLAYLDPDGGVAELVELDSALRRNSIRHLALCPDGTVVAAMQWHGLEQDSPPLLFTHRPGEAPGMLTPLEPLLAALRGYVGSVAVSGDGRWIAATSPVGGVTLCYDTRAGAWLDRFDLGDVCGLAGRDGGFLVSSGQGRIGRLGAKALSDAQLAWDNHIVAVPNGWA